MSSDCRAAPGVQLIALGPGEWLKKRSTKHRQRTDDRVQLIAPPSRRRHLDKRLDRRRSTDLGNTPRAVSGWGFQM